MLNVVGWRTLFVTVVVALCASPSISYSNTITASPQSQNVSSGVKSFSEWKKLKINETEQKIKTLRDKAKTEAGLPSELQSQLDQELLNLSVSRDLTISDYFVGYLTRQTALDSAIRNVSEKLTPEEVADLMTAYAEQLLQERPSNLKIAPRAESGN